MSCGNILGKQIAAILLGFSLAAVAPCIRTANAADDQGPLASNTDSHKDALAEIVVTGPRIARPELERLEPTQVLTSDFLDTRSYTNVIDALAELRAFGEPDNSLVGGQSSFGV